MVPKANIHGRKLMLTCFWDSQGVIYWELLQQSETINAVKFCEHLDKLHEALKTKRPKIVNRGNVLLHYDNAKPHVAALTKQKIIDLGWEVLQHPPYSPDLAPSDFYLFRSLQNALDRKKFNHRNEIEAFIQNFFDSKSQTFYEKAFLQLPEKWQKVIDHEGNYFH
jgi:histone-lysine N-methyltransferase SETMAR